MKSYYMVICLTVLLSTGCKKKQLIDERNINEIIILTNIKGSLVKNLMDTVKIKQVIDELNDAQIEPLYFKSDLILKIIYTDNRSLTILSNRNYIMINGLTYKIDQPILNIIALQ